MLEDSKEGRMGREDESILDIKNPHDKFFKLVFGDIGNLTDFTRSNLPRELRKI